MNNYDEMIDKAIEMYISSLIIDKNNKYRSVLEGTYTGYIIAIKDVFDVTIDEIHSIVKAECKRRGYQYE